MSSLNNVYGVSNGCPAFMNDGRGVNTDFRSNSIRTTENYKKIAGDEEKISTHDYRARLFLLPGTDEEFNKIANELSCTSTPANSGEIVIDREISLKSSRIASSNKQFGGMQSYNSEKYYSTVDGQDAVIGLK